MALMYQSVVEYIIDNNYSAEKMKSIKWKSYLLGIFRINKYLLAIIDCGYVKKSERIKSILPTDGFKHEISYNWVSV